MFNRLTLTLAAPLALIFAGCDDAPPPPPPQSSEELLNQAVPIDSKAQAELIKETEALKSKREEAKAELEKIRKETASMNERLEALQKGDLTKASSGNTEEAGSARLTNTSPGNPASGFSASAAKSQLEAQLITLNLKNLCDLALTQMDLTGKTSLTFDDLVGKGKPMPALKSHAGEVYAGLVFNPEKKVYEVTTIDGRVIRYERGK